MVQLGQRIAVVGSSGSGKSYVAQQLARRLGYRYVCKDAMIWGPNWTIVPGDARVPVFAAALAGNGWTIDGNIGSGTEDQIIRARMDTLIWLDLPRHFVYSTLLRRTLRRAWTGEELWHGNRESFRLSFASRDSILLWAWKAFPHQRARYQKMFADPALANVRRVRLTTRNQVNALLRGAVRQGDPLLR